MKKVAVIIPTYRPESGYLERCFNSLNAQTLNFDNFTVYIGLNGSEVNHFNLIHSLLKDVSFTYKLYQIEEPGVSNCRNFLMEQTEEDYLTFIDDDDYVSSNYLESLLEVSTPHTVGVAKLRLFDGLNPKPFDNYRSIAYDQLSDFETNKIRTRMHFSPICGKIIHRRIIGDASFDEKLKNGEDSLFLAEISSRLLAFIKPNSESCYYIYQRTNSASRKKLTLKVRLKNTNYLLSKYCLMLADKQYEKLFVITRILATLKKLFLSKN